MSILSVQDISKRYKFREVVKGISLEITSGEVVGLLGPNGAGKTTAFYMIVGLIACDRGRILLDGRVHRRIGVVVLILVLLPVVVRAGRQSREDESH